MVQLNCRGLREVIDCETACAKQMSSADRSQLVHYREESKGLGSNY